MSTMEGGQCITEGKYEFPATCSVADLDWNHMDQEHRPWIHNTYQEALRVYTSKDLALSLCKVPIGPLKLQILITDIRAKPGLFYQCYSLLSLIYIQGVLENTSDKMCFSWSISSHWLLKPLHFFIARKLFRMNHIQIQEDLPIRERRRILREQGFSFKETSPDYLSSNSKDWVLQYPLPDLMQLNINEFPFEVAVKKTLGPIGIIFIRKMNESLHIWPEACPHQGGPLIPDKHCADFIQCPWHGQKIPPLILNQEAPTKNLQNLLFQLKNNILTVSSITI